MDTTLLACSANNLILFDNGLVLSFPTIVIAALLDKPVGLSLNAAQASWFASISLICQPIGSLFSGLAMEPLGRKRSMLLLNIPFFTGWTLVHFADDIDMLYIAAAIMGFSVGCTEAPILTFVGEISEPKYRGTLASYAQLCGSMAYFVVYLLGSLTSWKSTATFCACVPVVTALAISFVPETPLWLISRGRVADAERALQWLRGWVSPAEVSDELHNLIHYHKQMTTGLAVKKQSSSESQEVLVGVKDMSLRQKFRHFLRPEMMKPLGLIVSYFFFFYSSGFQTIRPYLVPVFQNLRMTIDPEDATVIIALVGVLGYAACMISVKKLGKRLISLISLGGCAVCTFGLAAVASDILPVAWAFILMLAYSFFASIGVAPIPWMLQSELYPFQGKCLAAGVAAAASYIIGFFATKTYLELEGLLGLEGVFILFGAFSIAGFLFLYTFLPETEGRSFEQIAENFSKKKSEEEPTVLTIKL
ncbi:Sugar (and other) transporter [Nesidiocoris tenuis]|uniref:Sugar (And other) transporter n=1 Tax=Nesidiocoris tenuis TaxID=355587 RepID=A0ABN7B6K2_9HEMI|nr:Sugar (and other) transporter [Nesidiocoris tenuis]